LGTCSAVASGPSPSLCPGPPHAPLLAYHGPARIRKPKSRARVGRWGQASQAEDPRETRAVRSISDPTFYNQRPRRGTLGSVTGPRPAGWPPPCGYRPPPAGCGPRPAGCPWGGCVR
jgi:hypothetical protein